MDRQTNNKDRLNGQTHRQREMKRGRVIDGWMHGLTNGQTDFKTSRLYFCP